MGSRIDTVLLVDSLLFVLEFKVGANEYSSYAINQVYDYALDLKNFHSTSRDALIAPILIATHASAIPREIKMTVHGDRVFAPICSNAEELSKALDETLQFVDSNFVMPRNVEWKKDWEKGRYSPTPTIIEAATALYNDHSVTDISRSDAAAVNLTLTSTTINEIIEAAKKDRFKAICFVTGVPGAGKTLVGLNIATQRRDEKDELHAVFLSGNKPLVDILREALTRDRVRRDREALLRPKKGQVMSAVKKFIQNVHHFRDDCIIDQGPPDEHVALFDEAQRAWDLNETASFMLRKKQTPDFSHSEAEFLISCLDRHPDWAVIVCLVGGGQEINRGEAGISEWINSLNRGFINWQVYLSSRLTDSEYSAGKALEQLTRPNVFIKDELHLNVSMRSFPGRKRLFTGKAAT